MIYQLSRSITYLVASDIVSCALYTFPIITKNDRRRRKHLKIMIEAVPRHKY